MAKINIILQGFVDINLETDENINTKIVPKTVGTGAVSFNPNAGGIQNLPKSFVLPSVLELPVSIEEVFVGINVNSASVQAAHVQGSRLYGVDDVNSDWDLAIISTDETSHTIRETTAGGVDFDVHVYSQEEFQSRLDSHDMRKLEFIYHPDNVKLINNKEFTVDIDKNKLIERVKFESDDLWSRGRVILETGSREPYIALKDFWHSFRFLIFAEQILKDGSITDFSAANSLYESIINSKQTDFAFFEINFSVLRETMKLNLNTYLEGDNLESIVFNV